MSVRWASVLLGFSLLSLSPRADEAPDAGRADFRPEPIRAEGIDNLFRLSPRLLSGSQPEGAEGFATLERLGVRTIITVDGTTPDVAAAHRLGMRYVHLPVGYDGVPADQAARLVKAMNDLPGPVYVHCHHGKHRGPAAAAVIALSTEGWTRAQARAWLDLAGTDPNYRGLFATVAGFRPPAAEALARLTPADLPERAEVPALVEAMIEVDARWDHLKAIRAAGFRTPPGQPDLDPPHEALILAEQFREARRGADAQARGADFLRLLADAEQAATKLQAALRADRPRAEAESAFARVGERCNACHARFRNEPTRREKD